MEEYIMINGKPYRKFIRYPGPVDDDTLRCIACGQIDEEEYHDPELCQLSAPLLRNGLAEPQPGEWEVWFAWYPVTLLTLEIAWLRKVRRRPSGGWGHLSSRARIWDYANL